MPYTINKTDGSVVAVVADGTVDNTTSLKLIGKNYAGYGEIQNENFLFLLENFANTSAPGRAIAGQLWFDSGNGKLKFNDGTKWRTTGGAETGATQPTGLTVGDFWWDTQNKQLYASNGDTTFTLVGPQGVAGLGTTQMRSRSVRDIDGNARAIIEAVVGTGPSSEQVVFIISPHANFILAETSAIDGFAAPRVIHKGITLAYTNGTTGVSDLPSSTEFRYWGTASDSEKLGGYAASAFVRSGSAIFTTPVQFGDVGFTVGETPKLRVFNSSNTTPTIQNLLNDTITFQTTVGGSTKTPLQLVGVDLKPGSDNISDIGTSGVKFKTVYAYTFSGTATQANSLSLSPGTVASGYTYASIPTVPGTIVVRTSFDETINGTNITAGAVKGTFFVGTATSANYADLAEKYLADREYEVGTVVIIGGEKEVTAAQPGFRAIGAVSENPAYMMNAELEGGTYIALKGRVPVKVVGPVIKGQRLVAGANGTAQNAMGNTADYFAIALETSDEAGVRLVECLIL